MLLALQRKQDFNLKENEKAACRSSLRKKNVARLEAAYARARREGVIESIRTGYFPLPKRKKERKNNGTAQHTRFESVAFRERLRVVKRDGIHSSANDKINVK